LKVPAITTNIKTAELNINSYDIIAAVDLKEPKKAYFEFAAHPASKIPYTPREDKAKEKSIPKDKSLKANPCPKGIIAQPNKLKLSVETGAKINIILLACEGMIFSFKISFKASLKG
jgi:hypothetical protein